MNTEPLVRSVLTALMLLENSDSSEVDPDVAVAGMEAISHELHQMGTADVAEFVAVVRRIADEEADPHYRAFYRSVPFALGMAD